MSRIWRKTEERAVTSVPWNVGGPLQTAVTQSRALALNPVFSALRHITDFGSTLPLKAHRKIGLDESVRAPLPQLFRDLEADGKLIGWLCQGIASLAIRGNSVGYVINLDGFGFPSQIVWLSMDRVFVDDSSGVGQWYVDGRKESLLSRGGNLVHIPWMQIPGRTLGLSPIEHYAATINAGLGSQQYGNDWFAGGGFPPSWFRNTEKTLKDGQPEKIRARLVQSIRRREPLVTGKDWEYHPITIPPEQAQFIETQKLSASQVAAVYGIDPTEVGGESANSLTYTTEETRQIRRAADMRPYLTRFEKAFSAWVASRVFVKFNTDATIRVDTKTRHEVYKIQHEIGLTSNNERRAKEDLPPVEGGDSHVPAAAQQQAQQQDQPQGTRRLSVVHDQEAQYE